MQCNIMSGEAAFAAGRGSSGFVLVPTVLYPKSVGSVSLASASVFDAPRIDPNFLSHPDDIEVLSEVVDIARTIARQPPLARLVERELQPAGCENLWGGHPEIDRFLRGTADTLYHPCGTCKMGSESDPSAVVDPRLQVLGCNFLCLRASLCLFIRRVV
jgi:choline dehydrogenase